MRRSGLLLVLLSTLLLAACGPQPRARIPSSGVTGPNGGGEVELGNAPVGTTNRFGM